jgi:hypothetical protein
MKRDFSDYFIIKDPINQSFIQLSLSDDELLLVSTQSKLKKPSKRAKKSSKK